MQREKDNIKIDINDISWKITFYCIVLCIIVKEIFLFIYILVGQVYHIALTKKINTF